MLTPLDVDKTSFHTAWAGYRRGEVDQFLERVSSTLENLINQIGQLHARIGQLESELARYKESEELLKNSVMLAQKTSDELLAVAHRRADEIKREAEHEGVQTRQRLAQLRAEREQFEYAFHGLLSGFLHRLEQGNPALAGRAEAVPSLEPGNQEEKSPELAFQEEERSVKEQTPPAIPEVPVPDVPDVPAVPSPHDPSRMDRDADLDLFSEALDTAEFPSAPAWPPEAPQEPDNIQHAGELPRTENGQNTQSV